MTKQFYTLFFCIVFVIGTGFAFSPLYVIGLVLLTVLAVFIAIDWFLLYRKGTLSAKRFVASRWSNGDDNEVAITIKSAYDINVHVSIIDELPFIFQIRDFVKKIDIKAHEEKQLKYKLQPKERGVYQFGNVILIVKSRINLLERRIVSASKQDVKVYPSFIKLKSYELTTLRDNHVEDGIKRMRRIGNATEFAQIKDYVPDDDYRKINWKASARRNQLMVNVYEDEKSQFVYNIIDKGRVMQQSFQDMTLLDHSINASLVVSHIAMKKGDNVGLLTFDNKPQSFLSATHHSLQMSKILETLYNINTDFLESDFAALNSYIDKKITKRSLLILYTNFFSIDALKRQLPYLTSINKRHRVLIVFFEDHEQNEYIKSKKENVEDYYRHVIAENYAYERRFMVNMLRQNGILSILTEPANLNVNIINKYIEIKSRNMF